MSCNSQNCCQSGCYKDTILDDREEVSLALTNAPNEMPFNSVSAGSGRNHPENSVLCVKCKLNESMASTSAEYNTDSDISRFCGNCFRSNLYGKFRLAVSSNALISPSDNVLVAFSGGTSSRVALQFVHEMQLKALKNFEASRDRSLPVFGVGVVFIDERSSLAVPTLEFDKAIEDMKLIVSNIAPPAKKLHVVPTEDIFPLDSIDGRERFKELVDAVHDDTGREDLVKYLRMLSLQKVAQDYGYSKIVLGTCTSRIACHVLEATVKGQGYSLAADIQYVDARWKIPVILPLRDCLSQELNILCNLDSLKTIDAFKGHHSGINALITSFVKLLQAENPSRESTIFRTAGKLTPFRFNRMPEADDLNSKLATQRRQKKYNLKPNESLPPESFCRICNAPLKLSDVKSCNLENGTLSAEVIRDKCCMSCQFQVLPKDTSVLEQFFSLFPQQMEVQTEYNSSSEERLQTLR
ncbi:OLC1v1004154C1 [Oldenlandia corymbosa var. corymbosa]|uniref:Cytoplasmic tRNA 2-thiolation protein 2 n=1 Tax=Oldenlandia corymbosa var. corymbosa TaxID=529605 RepID=A0AAV1DF13_OLDCO|nr:OLC1v1004154C1 [Oldenlandia corymbosa var. corymbosa]